MQPKISQDIVVNTDNDSTMAKPELIPESPKTPLQTSQNVKNRRRKKENKSINE